MTGKNDGNLEMDNDLSVDPTPIYKRRRYLVVFMAFLGLFNVYALRSNLNVAIVSMTENRTIINEFGKEEFIGPIFDWNSKEKGYILSAFYYGYLCTQIIGGVIAAKIGGNILFGIGIGVTAVFTLLTPLASNWSIYALIVVRVLMGLFEGVTYSALYEMWSKWAPPFERSRMVVAAFTGNYVGLVISLPVSGILAKNVGWEWVFYVFGIIGCVWTVFWLLLIRRSPGRDPFISIAERRYIEQSLNRQSKDKAVKIPWKAIWTSSAVWAIIAAQFSEGWGFFTLQTQLPQFLKDALGYDIAKSGLVSALPYLCMAAMLQVAGYLSDWVRIKGYWTTGQTRRYFNSMAFLIQMASMLCAAFFLNEVASVTFITIGVAMAAFAYSSFSVNYLDIAPQFAGLLMGICNSFATVAGIVSPILTGYIVTDASAEQWKIIFYIAGGIYLFGCIIYFIWAEGEVQPWAIQEDINATSGSTEINAKQGTINPALDIKE
ncbi:sialin-like [Chironomus tepperi]|uniref:sialin-like n=1 Tax=Chironomus tepperi TaxID=113505 RepID=UPI00391F696D